MAPPLRNVLETCIYVSDMQRARDFYEKIIGLQPQFSEDRITGYPVGDTMLLLFLRGGTLEPVKTPGGVIPTHDGKGPAHFALSIPSGSQDQWRDHLEDNGVEVESVVEWPNWKSKSLYFRDPDDHLVELATAGLWGIG